MVFEHYNELSMNKLTQPNPTQPNAIHYACQKNVLGLTEMVLRFQLLMIIQ
ncbi:MULTISPECIES: hypothetical protein [unclassified Gilliamella]|uniref:hypothetical protein n=1 Tax=unclassified Gilliamella TaxID=2685620 RepID=UPI00226A2796|nr:MULTISPECIES: hypothetical protein [unclassified Gilliamella]MCX8585166.1 hypothetical protein [Gilliamella sp. B3562]MCX8685168.1 hypothetical protein [Gilliamella sp. B2864]